MIPDKEDLAVQAGAAAIGRLRGIFKGVLPDDVTIARAVLAASAPSCTCTPHPYGEGPEPDCPVHGAVRALNETMRERDDLAEKLAAIPAAIRGALRGLEREDLTPDGVVRRSTFARCLDLIAPYTGTEAKWYTITSGDVGKSFIHAWGKTWMLGEVIGRVQFHDIGKRVYRVRDNAGVRDILQVENEVQRNARLLSASATVTPGNTTPERTT